MAAAGCDPQGVPVLKDVSIETDGQTKPSFWEQTLEQTRGLEPAMSPRNREQERGAEGVA